MDALVKSEQRENQHDPDELEAHNKLNPGGQLRKQLVGLETQGFRFHAKLTRLGF